MTADLAPEILKANRSARSKGAVGANAIVPRLVKEIADKADKILDFGCGPDMMHALALRLCGFNVDAWDFGKNWREGMVYEVKENYYDIIYASNVVNTCSTNKMLNDALLTIHLGLKPNGTFICNYPESPRYMPDMKAEYLRRYLDENYIWNVAHLRKSNIFICTL